MKPILWVLGSIYLTLLVDVTLCAPSQKNEVKSSQPSDASAPALDRTKRASRTGQTQSQYLNFGGSQTEGKADAEITRYGSRASVSGSNGMGQAQSQSSGGGCDECYGAENGYTHGTAGQDPLRSSSGSSTGLPQSQTSSGIPSISSGPGLDAYGRPIDGPSSGYNTQGGIRSSPSERIKDVYSHGYPGVDSQPGGTILPGSGSITEQQPGLLTHGGRGLSTLGSDSFLNRPLPSNGQNSKISGDIGRPSILATRKPISNGFGPGKLIDGTNGGSGGNGANGGGHAGGYPGGHSGAHPGGHSGGHGTYTPPDGSSTTNGRISQRPNSNLPSYSQVHSGPSDSLPSGKSQSLRPGSYDSQGSGNGYPEIGRNQNIPSGGRGQNLPKQTTDAFSQPHGRPIASNENGVGGSPDQQSTDIISGFRNAFKLPPGLCLVRCDTLKPGQALTPEQIKDALDGQTPTTSAESYPQGVPSGQYPQSGASTAPISQGGVPSGQYPQGGSPSSQYPQGSGSIGPISQGGSPSGQNPQGGTSSGQYPQGGAPSGQYPQGSGSTGPISQGGVPSSQYPQGGSPPSQYPQGGTSSGQYPQGSGSIGPISQGGVPSGQYPQGGTSSGQYPQGGTSSGQYPQGGAPSGQYPQGSGSIGPISQGGSPSGQYPQGGTSSGQYPQGGGSIVQYPQGGVPSGQYPQGGGPIGQYPQGGSPSGQYPQGGGPIGQYPQGGSPSGQYPQGGTSSGQYPQGGASLGQYPQGGGSIVQYPQGGVPSGQYPHFPSGQYPQGGASTASIPQGGAPSSQFPPTGVSSGQYPQFPSGLYSQGRGSVAPVSQGGAPTGQYPQSGAQTGPIAQTGAQSGQFTQPTGSQLPSSFLPAPSTYPQYPSQGQGLPQYTQTSGPQIPPSASQVISGQPSQYQQGGQLPSPLTPDQVSTGKYGQTGYPSSQVGGPQFPTQGQGGPLPAQLGQYTQAGGPSQYPQGVLVPSGSYPQVGQGTSQGQGGAGQYLPTYPGGQTGAGGQTGGGGYRGIDDSTAAQTIPQNYVAGGSTGVSEGGASSTGEEEGYSQAESSIKNGEVIASAQGTKNGGTAQTQVQGTYSGSGSFSASAQTADKDRSAQAQVSGHKDGALSSSQGTGGKSQAQTQVEVNEKSGSTSASGQTSGAQHSSQSEVTANEKGGLADAQSSGPGQTSSQAQIGFKPESGSNDQASNPFNGGGQASAQSGVHSGQSQSQIHGSFKYGIAYHGAAQAASGTKEQVTSYREKAKKLFQSIGQFSRSNRDAVPASSISDIANINDIGVKPKQTSATPDPSGDDSFPDDADYEADEGDEEYEDENATTEKSNGTKTKSSRMEVQLPARSELINSIQMNQDHSTTPATPINAYTKATKSIRLPAVRSEIVPDGFKGKIEDKRPKHNLTSSKNQLNTDETKVDVKPDSYVTVTKSVSGSLDSAKATPTDNKKFESTYYTKSSTCGYFTFSCNIVYGSNGRSKICRPKAPANGKC